MGNSGDVLRQLRVKAGMRQEDLAREAGISIRTLQGWESGRRQPVSAGFFEALAALGIDVGEFTLPNGKRQRGRPRKT